LYFLIGLFADGERQKWTEGGVECLTKAEPQRDAAAEPQTEACLS